MMGLSLKPRACIHTDKTKRKLDKEVGGGFLFLNWGIAFGKTSLLA